jgi:hypothetical protein
MLPKDLLGFLVDLNPTENENQEPTAAFLHFLCTVCGNYLERARRVPLPILNQAEKPHAT